MNLTHCPNFNHRRASPPVAFCPTCGEVVNDTIAAKECTDDAHARGRMNSTRFCVNCGDRLIAS